MSFRIHFDQKSLKRARSYKGLFIALAVFGGASLLGHGPMNQEMRIQMDENKPLFLPTLNFKLTEVSDITGVKNTHQGYSVDSRLAHVGPYLSAVGASVAVVDFNNDGWPDIYLNNSAPGSKNLLFKNNHDGTFTEMAEKAGIADVNSPYPSTRAIFFDVNNSGYKDLFLLSYCPRLFLNQHNGTFSEVTKDSSFGCGFFYGGINVFDRDGLLDLVVSRYFGRDVLGDQINGFLMPNSFHNATNGESAVIFRNDGKGHFFPAPDNYGIEYSGWSHAIGVYDIQGTGRPDLWFPTDYNLDKLYLNNGKNGFKNASEAIRRGYYSRNGMSVDFANLGKDGHPVAYVSHIYIPGQRITGNVMWEWQGNGEFSEIAREKGVESCGWSWGAKFFDLNNDGNLDLLVGNGFISDSREKNYWYPMNVLDSALGEMMKDVTYWPPMDNASLAGYEKPCLFLNDGQKFVNVAELTPFGQSLEDERGVAYIDYMNNGSLSFVLANQKQQSKFYQNRQLNANQWIGFKLVGSKSNRAAFGAEVTLNLEHRKLIRQLQPINGYASQSDDRLHFGLGLHPNIQSIRIRWPSGIQQGVEMRKVRIGQYNTIYEPHKLNSTIHD